MLKKIVLSGACSLLLASGLYASKVTQAQCIDKGENYLFAAGECVELKTFAAENNDRLILLVHGSWKPGTNILGRYAPFAESINMNTDVTTVAVALPGYSGSSSNMMPPLEHEAAVTPSATREYITYLGKLVKAIKEKYNAQEITYVGHSAGARMGATLSALEPGLIKNAVLAGGRYINKPEEAKHGAISFDDVKAKADKETKYVLVYGSADTISEPSVTTSYYEQMKKDGFDVTLVEAKGAPHLDLEMTDATQNAIVKLFE
jgi:predicted esterase